MLLKLLLLSTQCGSQAQQQHENDAEHIRNPFAEHQEKSTAKSTALYQFPHCVKHKPLRCKVNRAFGVLED